MEKPLLSVIVPVYNNQKYLRKCLSSLVNQTLSKIEIIVVNDGSTDNSQLIIDEYVSKYPNKIKAYIKSNSGVSDTRNFGIDASSGDFVGFVDSDDWVSEDMYEKLVYQSNHFDHDIVCCGCINVYSNSSILVDCIREKNIGKYGFDVILCNKIFKLSFINSHKFRFYSGIRLEDKELFIRMLSCTNKIGYIDEHLYYYNRTNINSMMNTRVKFPIDQRKIILSLECWQKLHQISDEGYEYKLVYEVCLYLWFHETVADKGHDIFKRYKWRILFNRKLRYTFKIKAILMMISPKLVNMLIKTR